MIRFVREPDTRPHGAWATGSNTRWTAVLSPERSSSSERGTLSGRWPFSAELIISSVTALY